MARKDNPNKIRLLLADDHPVVRQGVRICLEQYNRFEIVGEASKGEEAIRMACSLMPDVMLLDINMPGANGLQVTEQLSRLAPQVRILILSVEETEHTILQVIRSGAKGYLLKNTTPEELVTAIEAVAAGKTYYSQFVAQTLRNAESASQSNGRRRAPGQLTPREIQILTLIANGYSNKQVAAELNLSIRTVEAHRENMMRKLHLHNVADLTRYAITKGIVRLD
ncbi:MAG: response regulator transcription factor [Verrucomicrobiae bacterium]|nr:response regulator transcription factor [Verrucomicrobiae bacterium]